MAGELIEGSGIMMPNLSGAASTLSNAIMVILGLLIFGAVMWFIFYISQFKHKVRVRVVTEKGRSYIDDDKARVIKMDGVKFWHLLSRGHKIPVPPSDSICTGKKGEFAVEVYFVESSEEYQYIKFDKDGKPEVQAAIPTEKGKYMFIQDSLNTAKSVEALQSLTTNQRQILINQLVKANSRIHKTWKDVIRESVPIIAMVILVICLMVFYADIAEPVLKMGKIQSEISAQQAKMLVTLQEMIENKQIFTAESPPQS